MIFKALRKSSIKLKENIIAYDLVYQDEWTHKHYIIGVYYKDNEVIITDWVTDDIEAKVKAMVMAEHIKVA